MKDRLGKIGIICLALVIGLGVLGAGFAYWQETLGINAVVETGELDIQFTEGCHLWEWSGQLYFPGSDDDGIPDLGVSWNDDGNDIWRYGGWHHPYYGFPRRIDQNLGCCTITKVDDETYRVSLSNVYPGYMAKVWWWMQNKGTIPAKMDTVTLSIDSDPNGIGDYVWAAARVSIQVKESGLFKYDLKYVNSDRFYNNPGLLNDFDESLATTLTGYVLQPGWSVFVGCDEEETDDDGDQDPASMIFVIDKDAPNSIEGSTLSFTLHMTWTQFNS